MNKGPNISGRGIGSSPQPGLWCQLRACLSGVITTIQTTRTPSIKLERFGILPGWSGRTHMPLGWMIWQQYHMMHIVYVVYVYCVRKIINFWVVVLGKLIIFIKQHAPMYLFPYVPKVFLWTIIHQHLSLCISILLCLILSRTGGCIYVCIQDLLPVCLVIQLS